MHRVAVVGAGVWSENHRIGWRAQPDVEIACVVRSSEEKARETAKRWGVADATSDWRRVLQRDDIDIVDILLPHDMHADAAIEAIRQGKHVVMEKPLATTIADAERLAEAAERSDRTVMISENWIYATVVSHARARIDAGEIGEPFMIRSSMDMEFRAGFEGLQWRAEAARMGGGVLLDAGTHAISGCRHLMGEITDVAATVHNVGFPLIAPLEDTAMVLMRFASGATGTVSVTGVAARERPRTEFVVLGTKGTLEFDTHDRLLVTTTGGRRSEEVFMGVSRGFVEQMAHFMECLRTSRTPLTSPAEQVGSLRAVLAAYRSAETGSFVRLDEV